MGWHYNGRVYSIFCELLAFVVLWWLFFEAYRGDSLFWKIVCFVAAACFTAVFALVWYYRLARRW